MIYLSQKIIYYGEYMPQKDVWIFRNDFPGIQLPFYPRGAGINCFSFNQTENHIPQDFCEICWVAEGKCIFDNGRIRQELCAGQTFFRMPMERRYKRVTSPGGAVIYYVTFDGKNAVNFFRSFGYSGEVMDSGACPVWLFERIIRALASPAAGDYRRCCALYTELFARLIPDGEEKKLPQFVHDCLHHIRVNCTNHNFNINILADKLAVHRSTVSRKVKQYTGMSAQQYLDKCRTDYAIELLSSTALSILETSKRAGFSRSNYFCRLIRKKFSCTPAELRKMLKTQ